MSERSTALPVTMTVPQFGRLAFDISENSAYAAAVRGEIPTVDVGGLKKVPVRMALRKLAGDDPATLEAVTNDFALRFLQLAGKTKSRAAA